LTPTSLRRRVAVLISGRGSNMAALVEAARAHDYPAEIVGVFSNKATAAGLDFARANGIATATASHRDFPDRDAFDAEIDRVLAGWNAEIVCLAGFMRILSAGFVTRWQGRMINMHPSLLPAYKGLDPHGQALADGASEHGCTVHWVTPELDDGPAIAAARVPVLPGDTVESLSARVLVEEHTLYPKALAMVARGEARLNS
jgi:phosphoribosylglycinamide formyltransferase-1